MIILKFFFLFQKRNCFFIFLKILILIIYLLRGYKFTIIFAYLTNYDNFHPTAPIK